MSNNKIEELLRVSAERATPLGKQLFRDSLWTGDEVAAYVNGVGSASVATVSAEHWPHATWVPITCVDGELFLAGTAGSVFLRNIDSNGRIALTITRDAKIMQGQGRAVRVALSGEIEERFAKLDEPGLPPGEQAWRSGIVRVDLKRLFAR